MNALKWVDNFFQFAALHSCFNIVTLVLENRGSLAVKEYRKRFRDDLVASHSCLAPCSSSTSDGCGNVIYKPEDAADVAHLYVTSYFHLFYI